MHLESFHRVGNRSFSDNSGITTMIMLKRQSQNCTEVETTTMKEQEPAMRNRGESVKEGAMREGSKGQFPRIENSWV